MTILFRGFRDRLVPEQILCRDWQQEKTGRVRRTSGEFLAWFFTSEDGSALGNGLEVGTYHRELATCLAPLTIIY